MQVGVKRERSGLADTLLGALGVLATIAAFVLNYRYVLQQFSNQPYLLDAGWFAYLLGAGDPGLHNPSAIDGTIFYNFHLSPYLGLLSVAFHALGIDGFSALAWLEGIMFAGLTAALAVIAIRGRSTGVALLGLASTIGCSVLGNTVLQIAGYPHFEIAFVTLGLISVLLLRTRQPLWALIPIALDCLVREDGGLYAALFLLGSTLIFAGLPVRAGEFARRLEVRLAAGAIFVALLMLAVKQVYFWHFSAFTADFSGDHWRHLTLPFVAGRLFGILKLPQFAIALAVTIALGCISWRYLVFLVLVSPLLLLQTLAVRDNIGRFELYYAIPWLIVWVGLFLAAYARSLARELRLLECLILFGATMALNTPIPEALGIPTSFFVARGAATAPVVDLVKLQGDIESALATHPRSCVSAGVATIAPNAVTPAQELADTPDLAGCDAVFLFRGDLSYDGLKPQIAAAAFRLETVLGDRVEIYLRP